MVLRMRVMSSITLSAFAAGVENTVPAAKSSEMAGRIHYSNRCLRPANRFNQLKVSNIFDLFGRAVSARTIIFEPRGEPVYIALLGSESFLRFLKDVLPIRNVDEVNFLTLLIKR